MDNNGADWEADPFLRKLYPELNDEELRQAQENFDRYVDLILRIYARIRQDSPAYAAFPDFLAEAKRQHA